MRYKSEHRAIKNRSEWSKCAPLVAAVMVGCAREPSIGVNAPVSIYSLEEGHELLERVAIGDEIDVVARANVMIRSSGENKNIVDFEMGNRKLGLTYCWFVYQYTGVNESWGPVLYLMNPNYRDYGQPRYIGAVASDGSNDFVVPLKEERDEDEVRWVIPPPPARREDVLFTLKKGTLAPEEDQLFLRNIKSFCRETTLPEYYVTEYGETYVSLAVYQER